MKFAPNRRRLIWLLSVGSVFMLAGWGYVEYFMKRPIGNGPAGPTIKRSEYKTPWSEKRVLLVGIGDSITAGLGAKSTEHTFFNRLRSNPDDEWPDMSGACLSAVLPNLESLNLAVSGTTSLRHAAVIEERLEAQEDDVFGLVVMTTGGNDIIHSYGRRKPREGAMYGATSEQAKPWIKNFSRRLGSMLDSIDARFPGGCEIYLADIYDPTDGVGDAPSVYLPHWPQGLAIHAQYNQAIHQCANERQHVHVVPLYRAFLGHGSHCRQFWRSTYVADDPYYWYFENIEDPNDRGYDAIRRVFLNAIQSNSTLADRRNQRDGLK